MTATHVAPAAIGRGDPQAPTGDGCREVVIRATRGWPSLQLRELWAYRSLLLFLVWRDLKVRYAQTVFGAAWAVIQPVVSVGLFTVVFGHLAKVPSDGQPYSVFSLAAFVPWLYFATALSSASGSLVAGSHLLTKIYFPRLVIPLAPVFAGLVDFAIALALLLAVLPFYHLSGGHGALLVIPLLVFILMLTAAGVGCWLAALNIRYRDVKHAVPFLVQVWMYASPVVYPSSLVPAAVRPWYGLNPLVGVIDGFRAALLGSSPLHWDAIGRSGLVAVTVFITGTLYFRRTERTFADVA